MAHGAPRDLLPTFLFNQPLPCRALATPQPALLFLFSDLFPTQASALARPLPGYSSPRSCVIACILSVRP